MVEETVFSIGDKVRYNKEKCNYDYFIIDNFFITKDNKMLVRSKDNLICEFIEDLDKVPQLKPLFKTEDGVDMFKGDKGWLISLNTWQIFEDTATVVVNQEYFTIYKVFHSKEKAEQYILENKPCLSLKEIDTADNETMTWSAYKNKLKELVQSKLKS